MDSVDESPQQNPPVDQQEFNAAAEQQPQNLQVEGISPNRRQFARQRARNVASVAHAQASQFDELVSFGQSRKLIEIPD